MQRTFSVHRPVLALIVVTLACRHSAQTVSVGESPSIAGGQPCRTTVRGIDVSDWEEIAASGFTFCVPSDGRQARRVWRSATVRLTWGTGPAGYDASDPTIFKKADLATTPSGEPFHRLFREEIGGRKADIQVAHDDRFFSAWARWNSPSVWLSAESESPSSEATQLAIFRTVRFTSGEK